MPVQSIECQLVRAQIGRYLGGEPLSGEAMRQLENHLVACDECKEALSSRKAELRAKMSTEAFEQKPKAKVATEPAPQRAVIDYKAIEAAVRETSGQPATKKSHFPKPNSFTKPLALTAVLGVVLIGMSRMSGGTGSPFGPKALTALFGDSAAATKSAPAAIAPLPATPQTAASPSGAQAVPATTPTVATPAVTQPAATTALSNAAPTATTPPATLQPTKLVAPTPAPTQPSPTATVPPTVAAETTVAPNTSKTAAPLSSKSIATPTTTAPKNRVVQPTTPSPLKTKTPAELEASDPFVPARKPIHKRAKLKAHKAVARHRRAAARHRVTHKPIKRHAVSRIRVYDESGSVLHP